MLTGQKIAQLRTQSNLTQEQLAEKLFITRELVSKWETGKSRPDYDTVLKMAEILSVEPDNIMNKYDMLLNELSECMPENCEKDAEYIIALLNEFLDGINERDRSVFVRRYYFLESTPVIAEEYNIKENNVRTILTRMRKKIKKYFKEVL